MDALLLNPPPLLLWGERGGGVLEIKQAVKGKSVPPPYVLLVGGHENTTMVLADKVL